MMNLGKKEEASRTKVEGLTKLPDTLNRPTAMPTADPGESVFCGFDNGLVETLYLCETLGEMQGLYDMYYAGLALYIRWYRGKIILLSS